MTRGLEPRVLLAPFPWYGGKSRAAPLIWEAIGTDVGHYVEPFAGSLATLLNRPGGPGTIETVNDRDCHLANVWRALTAAPEAVAEHVDWPVNEADLHARHRSLHEGHAALREAVMSDPSYYDAKVAGWWVWGICQWIGGTWCDGKPPGRQLPKLASQNGVHRKRMTRAELGQWFGDLRTRLRHVRVACGDWSRVVTDSVLLAQQSGEASRVGVLLDPPYDRGEMDYAAGGVGTEVASAAREWAIERGSDPRMRIVLCGLEGDHVMPEGWRTVLWGAKNGRRGVREETSECLWLSPHCLGYRQPGLFGLAV
jgi:hypothetical protein